MIETFRFTDLIEISDDEKNPYNNEPIPIIPRPEVSIEKQAEYEQKLASAALLRPKGYGNAQAMADKIRKRRQYGELSQRDSA